MTTTANTLKKVALDVGDIDLTMAFRQVDYTLMSRAWFDSWLANFELKHGIGVGGCPMEQPPSSENFSGIEK